MYISHGSLIGHCFLHVSLPEGFFPENFFFLFVLNPWLQNQDQETAIFIKIEKGRYNENEHDCQLIFVAPLNYC